MWRRLHILSPVQSLVVASLSAAIIAFSVVQSAPHNEAALLHDLLWPDSLDPYVAFSLVFIGVVPPLLGYYHLGRLGFLLNAAVGLVLAWLMAVCGIICFVPLGHFFGSVLVSTIAYSISVLLVYAVMARLHLRAARSPFVHDAQLKMRLTATGRL